MANYNTLISAIQSVIAANGNNEITGPILQQTLLSIVDSLGAGYQFIGIATPETTPGTPDQRVFYIGSAGTYPNFGPAVVPDGNMGIFYYDSGWHFGTVAFPIGTGTITETNLASTLINKLFDSGCKFAGTVTPQTTIQTPNQSVFYIGAPGQYSNFGLPAKTVNDGEIGFFKYINGQWLFETITVGKNYDGTINSILADIEEIQDELVGGNVTLDLSGATSINRLTISPSNLWAYANNVVSSFFQITETGNYKIEALSGNCIYAILNSTAYSDGGTPDFATGFPQRYVLNQGANITIEIPAGKYFWFRSENTQVGGGYVPKLTLLLDSNPIVRQSDIADNLNTEDSKKVLSAKQGYILATMDIDSERVKFDASGVATIGGRPGGALNNVANNDWRYPKYPPVGYHITKIYASSNVVRDAYIGIYTPGVGITNQQTFRLINGDVATEINIVIPVGSYLAIGNAIGLLYGNANIYGSYNITQSAESTVDLALWFDYETTSIGIEDYINEKINNYRPQSLVQIFPKVTTIGDSLMAGYTHQGSTIINSAEARAAGNNWPTYLCKRNGLTINNLAIGSSTAHNWRYADGPSAGNIANIEDANIATDCYYIGVGVNDLRNSLPIGTPSDIAPAAENNVDSFYGNYDFIVRACISYNPKCHIFTFAIPNSESGNANYNTAIKYISGLYNNVHCLDLSEIEDFTNGIIPACFANGHYDPLAYNLISTIIENLTNHYMNDHYSEFIVAPY